MNSRLATTLLAVLTVALGPPVAAATDEEQALAELADDLGVPVEQMAAAVPGLLAGIMAPRIHSQFPGLPLGTQLQILGSMVYHQPDVVSRYCNPTWICGIGCGQAHAQCQRPCDSGKRSCLARAERAELACNNEMRTSCGLRAECRQQHFDMCYERTQPDRDACNDAHTECIADCRVRQVSCKTCCYDSSEGAFDPFGLNLCVQKHFET